MVSRSDVRVAAEVAELLTSADLDNLRKSAAAGYRCVRCDEPGQLAAEPAAVVVRLTRPPGVAQADHPVVYVRLAHERCSPSQVITDPGSLAMPDEAAMTAMAAVIPHASGPRAVLITEPAVHISSVTSTGDRIDPMIAGLLGRGLHLLVRLGQRCPDASGWQIRLPSAVEAVVLDASGELYYAGELEQPRSWRELVAGCRKVELLTGVIGLGSVSPDSPGEGLSLLVGAARQGRLVGGAMLVS
jgi:hypothetical protein